MKRARKKRFIVISLLILHISLFTVVIGCGKKAPPSPPEQAVSSR